MNEEELKHKLELSLARDFEIQTEVVGRFLVDNSKVIIDYLMYPKPHLLERGFVKGWFGIEVKSPDKESTKKGLQVAWQSITYSQSIFGETRPAFVLIYPPLADFFGSEAQAFTIKCLLQKANVGYVEINSGRNHWDIRFGTARYFSSDKGLSKTPMAGLNRKVGTWK